MTLDMTHPSIADLARRARRRVPRFVWEYLDSGTGADTATAANRAALDRIRLVPKPLAGPVDPQLETALLGVDYALPVGIAPVGMSGLIWPGAEVTLAKAAARARVPYCLSTVAAATPETVGRHTGGMGWFQLYPPGDPDIRRDLLDRARGAGFHTLVLTADVPVASRRERLRRAGITNPMKITPRIFLDCALHPEWALTMLGYGKPRLVTLEKYADVQTDRPGTAHVGYLLRTAPDADYVKALRDLWPGKLVVKGVLDPAAARGLGALGVDAVWVSNHGGRQFDAAPAAIDALPLVREAVGPEMPVLFDGGIASGTDILRALALGADFTFVGRAPHYGLAAFGARGAAHVFDIFRASLEADMGQMGLARPADAATRCAL
ncbi:MAG: alpha-hydroxy acid oxidase [Paracoccaceae bacterium]|nr:alpha-hydroxy acid oxidase [Paracoccaceae bacterium]